MDIQQVSEELAVKWDGGESFVALAKLRRACPCAGCKGEVDIMGNLHKGPDIELSPGSFQLRSIGWVGTYGIQPVWADGHSSGIFSFELLRTLAGGDV
jgi:DUF971 family protein